MEIQFERPKWNQQRQQARDVGFILTVKINKLQNCDQAHFNLDQPCIVV